MMRFSTLMFAAAAVLAVYLKLWSVLAVIAVGWVVMQWAAGIADGIAHRGRPGSVLAFLPGLAILAAAGVVVLALVLRAGGVL